LIRKLTVTGHSREYANAELHGFTVRVPPAGRITYSYRWRRATGKHARLTVGCYEEGLGPKEARAKARRESALLDHMGDTLPDQTERKMKREEVRRVADVPAFGYYPLESYTPILCRSPTPATSARGDSARTSANR
jgi:hypothetical protein